ncbi:MAG: IgGFc-binding protein [Myxococcales bacterium]|nr:IgGFc-binding protein [Myxococcales bacterium]
MSRPRWTPLRLAASLALFALPVAASCSFDTADRWLIEETSQPVTCTPGQRRCNTVLERCEQTSTGAEWQTQEDCPAQAQVCNPNTLTCMNCLPGQTRCAGLDVMQCDSAGNSEQKVEECDASQAIACRSGGCVQLCEDAAKNRSNVGCEYWAVDLDNAVIDDTSNAAAQQFAVVVSNPQPDLTASVTIEEDHGAPGTPADEGAITIASADIPPLSLRVFRLGPREVDGSPDGEFNTGTGSALTRAAYRIKSQVPVIAYQFNPLENVNVFSNDASLLKPVEAIPDNSQLAASYVVLGWPQTIASTEDPNTNFNPANPIDLRAFVTIVGTRSGTKVRVTPTTKILGAPGIPATAPGEAVEYSLEPFDVLNLESDDFNADFTGSLIESTSPVVVFSGSEASDAPFFSTLASRRCCADHLEEQLDPIRTAGKRFIAPVAASRTEALVAGGASVGVISEPDYFRIVAVSERGARIKTSLAGYEELTLDGRGSFVNLTARHHFSVESDEPVMLAEISPSQAAAGVPRGLPGGDPSFIVIPPIEQFRPGYVFLTPDKYAFDFLRITAPYAARVLLDGRDVSDLSSCVPQAADGSSEDVRGGPPEYVVYTCQLSFPVIDPMAEAPNNLSPGKQNDGVHRIDSDRAVGVLVDGFDAYVSYGYAAGTELREIVVF